MKGIEPIMNRMKAILEEDLPAALDLLDVEYADFSLPDVQGVFIEGPDAPGRVYPAVYLFEYDIDLGRASTMGARTYIIEVDIWDECDAYGTLRMARRLWRYRRAIEELLRDHADQAGVWGNLQIEAEAHTPTIPQDEREDAYHKATALLVSVRTVETY